MRRSVAWIPSWSDQTPDPQIAETFGWMIDISDA